ncbi:MAG: hypothetical protein PHX79_06290 [Sphaerochaetaceae bacterium]|nr:hypothetical protein [Sphaerochaetaceae bacterium]
MNTIKINCPKCGLGMEYWTRRDFIHCTKCNTKIEVEPCKEEVEELPPEEPEEEGKEGE